MTDEAAARRDALRQEAFEHVRAAAALLPPPRTGRAADAAVARRIDSLVERVDWGTASGTLAWWMGKVDAPGEAEQHFRAAQDAHDRYEVAVVADFIASLTEAEVRMVGEFLRASVEGPFFGGHFHTLTGHNREFVTGIAEGWPRVDDGIAPHAFTTINNVLLNLLSYPHGGEDVWPRYISVPAAEVERIYDTWRGFRRGGGVLVGR